MPYFQVNINNEPFTKYLLQSLRKFENNETIEILEMHKEPACNVGDNYMSTVFRFFIYGTMICPLTNATKPYNRQVIIKTPLNTEDSKNVFKYEKLAYEQVVTKLEQTVRFRLPFARFIAADSHLICLEDLKETGFELAKRHSGFNLQESEEVLKSLAKFHASSIILKHEDVKAFKNLKGLMYDHLYANKFSERVSSEFQSALNMALNRLKNSELPIIKNNPRKLSEILEKLDQIKSKQLYEKLQADLEATSDEAQLICHGDFWSNNIMMRYPKENPTICDSSMFVDLQTFCVSSWVRDIIYFFSTNVQAVDKDNLSALYIENLQRILRDHSVPDNIVDTYNKDLLKQELIRLKNLYVITGIWLLTPIALKYGNADQPSDPRPAVENPQSLKLDHYLDEFYEEKIWGMVNYLNNQKYLDF